MKVITNKVRFNYPNVFTTKEVENGEARYSISILIPKGDNETINKINEAILNAKGKGIEKFKDLENIKTPLRDGDIEKGDDENYKNHYFLNATSKYKPQVVDKDLHKITDESEIYLGCYGRVSINFYPFCKEDVSGVGCGLLNVQKVADGERIGMSSAEDDFGVYKDFSEVSGTF